MLNVIWAVMILISFVCAIFTGRMPQLSEAVMKGRQCSGIGNRYFRYDVCMDRIYENCRCRRINGCIM